MGSAEVQGELWGAAARDWAESAERAHVPFYETAFDLLGVGPNVTLLDAGCGSGLALQLAHEQGAIASGLDAAQGLLDVAHERVPSAELRLGDLEDLPFPHGTFDAVSAFNSLQFAADPTRALSEMRRVVRPGGAVAVATWGDPEDCEMHSVLGALGSLLPAAPGATGPFALSAPGALATLIASAGLSLEHTVDVPTPFEYPSMSTAITAVTASGPGQRAIAVAGIDAVRATLEDAYLPFGQPDGVVKLDNVFRVVIAR